MLDKSLEKREFIWAVRIVETIESLPYSAPPCSLVSEFLEHDFGNFVYLLIIKNCNCLIIGEL